MERTSLMTGACEEGKKSVKLLAREQQGWIGDAEMAQKPREGRRPRS